VTINRQLQDSGYQDEAERVFRIPHHPTGTSLLSVLPQLQRFLLLLVTARLLVLLDDMSGRRQAVASPHTHTADPQFPPLTSQIPYGKLFHLSLLLFLIASFAVFVLWAAATAGYDTVSVTSINYNLRQNLWYDAFLPDLVKETQSRSLCNGVTTYVPVVAASVAAGEWRMQEVEHAKTTGTRLTGQVHAGHIVHHHQRPLFIRHQVVLCRFRQHDPAGRLDRVYGYEFEQVLACGWYVYLVSLFFSYKGNGTSQRAPGARGQLLARYLLVCERS
jgi:hypothetical protein